MARKETTETQSKKTNRTVFSFTEQAHGAHIPGYAALNTHADGSHWLTVRTSGGAQTAGICIPKDQLKLLAEAIAAELA